MRFALACVGEARDLETGGILYYPATSNGHTFELRTELMNDNWCKSGGAARCEWAAKDSAWGLRAFSPYVIYAIRGRRSNTI